jgi:RNA methyltransferase, TrmH family
VHITSLQNTRIKSILKLLTSKRQRERDGGMVVEGLDEIQLAMSAGHSPRFVVMAPQIVKRTLGEIQVETVTVDRAVFQKLSYRENPDGWLAVFDEPQAALGALHLGAAPLVVILEAVEKPGNIGAILRTADGAGVEAVIICGAGADVYSPNVVRASRGAVFAVPLAMAENADALAYLRARKIRILAATPAAEGEFSRQDLRGPLAIAVGAEDVGLSDFWMREADAKVRIPMRGKVNSLNVSVSAALIIYEALRQRTA